MKAHRPGRHLQILEPWRSKTFVMLTNLVRVCEPHFKYIVAGTKSLNARQSTNTSVSSDDITTALEPFLAAWNAWRRNLVSASSWVDVRSSLGLTWSAEISTQRSSVAVKRCFSVTLCLNLCFCHSSVTTLTNCFLFWGFDYNFLHCCILWSGCIFLYSIPV